MHALIDTATQSILEYPIKNLRARFPNTSFPRNLEEGSLPSNIVKVHIATSPVVTLLQVAELTNPGFNTTENKWTCEWVTRDKTPEEIESSKGEVIAKIKSKAQESLDSFARTKGYDNIVSVCSYANSTIPSYAQEGARAVELRDLTWSTLHQYLTDVEAGVKALPTTEDEIMALLPAYTW
ncbi:MAG: hypothetical protein IBX57_00810 [Gammaproteobacteria bacterium]|nr:hypothetical protein [Gammaproteobacteria bacterium]